MPEVAGKRPSERIRNYLKGNPELRKNDEFGEAIKLEDKDRFRDGFISTTKNSVRKYLKVKKDGQLAKVRIDKSIPLDLHVSRITEMHGETPVFSGLIIEIKRPGQEKNVADFGLRDYGDEFRLSHRKVDPNYRGNGIATSAMQAIEEFVKEYSREVPGREATIEANAAQLDILKWFDDSGFETTMDPIPLHTGEREVTVHNIDEVLTSLENKDGNYRVGSYLYVFPKSYTGPDFNGEGTEPENINIDDSALVHFRKRLNVESGSNIRNSTKDQILSRIKTLFV